MGESETEVSIKDVYILLKEVNKNLSQRIENIEESTNNLAKVLHSEVETIRKKADKLEEENKILKQQLNKIERKIITNNLVLYGLQETPEESKENLISSITHLFRNKLEVHLENSQINNIFRLGKRNTHNRPILLSLTTYLKKSEILRNCSKLKGTGIVVCEELTTKDLEDRKILLGSLKEARAKNKHAVIKGRTLIIEGEAYTVEDIQNFDKGNDYPTSPNIERNVQSEPSTPSPKEVDLEEDPAIQSSIDSEQEKATNSKGVFASKEAQNQSKITTKTRNISSNETPKKTTEIHRALRNQKKNLLASKR
ncbi:unnamed protein product [Phaedon cochleariae]|uniref:Endonuclease-reverse transcriptase n=1 Tax=Phaedon cochleariae TaxID=80249 RepID=A0A9N9SC57_PHACE|nr:unnamed protein product [Phaedon cochleariae]